MKIVKEILNIDLDISKYLDQDNKDVLFFDIETTGFHRDYTTLYLLGYVYFQDGKWYVEQHLATKPHEEIELLEAYLELIKKYETIITYNGDAFDFPYMNHKLKKLTKKKAKDFKSIDIYKSVKQYKPFLQLENYKLKTIEKLVGIYREDPFTGGDLIEQYHDYSETGDSKLEYNLLLHNKEDMIALLDLMKIYDLLNLFSDLGDATYIEHVEKDGYLRIQYGLKYVSPLTWQIGLGDFELYFKEHLYVKVPYVQDTLLYFIKDYKNYYYLPDKDEVMHETLASFIPKNLKRKAKASNCYIRHEGCFLPLINDSEEHKVFRPSYKTKKYHIRMEEFVTVPETYAHILVQQLSKIKKV